MMNGSGQFYDAIDGTRYRRGGQTFNTTFLSAIVSAHSNMVYNPFVSLIVIVALFTAVSENFKQEGPLEALLVVVNKIIDDPTSSALSIRVATFLKSLDVYLIAHKILFIKLTFILAPFLFKPSTKNFIITLIFAIFVLLFTNWSTTEIGILAECWFLFTQVRTPWHKWCIAAFALLYVFWGWVEMEIKPSKYGSRPAAKPSTGPSPDVTTKPPGSKI